MKDELIKELGITTEMGRKALEIALENVRLFDKKQKDYGSRNISDFGLLGITVRLNDKLQRLITLTKNNAEPNNESLFDTLLDISNYGLIGQMLIKGIWK